jgi:hypothetical protein
MAGTSRVNREIYARFCGRLVVKFLRPTRHEGGAGGFAHMREQECAQRRQAGADPLHEASVGRQAGEIDAIVGLEAKQAERLEGPKMRKVKERQDGHHLAHAKAARPIALTFGISQQWLVFRRCHKVVELAKECGRINGGTHDLLPYQRGIR